ncbi:MAG: M20/M25/M40 family metallo-hydrolase, partial [Bacteroidota bacterium]
MLTIPKQEIAARAQRIVGLLAHEFPSRNGLNRKALQSAAEFIEQEFVSCGVKVRSESYPARGGPVCNLAVEQHGAEPHLPCIVIGAHYDTVLGTPGADDNASGVAGLIELARLLASYSNRRTIHFIAFPHEEPPYFYTSQMGSRVYAEQLKQKSIRVQLMFSLEMIG